MSKVCRSGRFALNAAASCLSILRGIGRGGTAGRRRLKYRSQKLVAPRSMTTIRNRRSSFHAVLSSSASLPARNSVVLADYISARTQPVRDATSSAKRMRCGSRGWQSIGGIGCQAIVRMLLITKRILSAVCLHRGADRLYKVTAAISHDSEYYHDAVLQPGTVVPTPH